MELADLRSHLHRGGAATLNHPATYAVAEGAVIAPARYAGSRGSGSRGSQFVHETRWVDGTFATTVLVDSKQSQSNRAEEGLITSRREGGAARRIPVISVSYSRRTLLDLELPHRAFDAHIRAATHNGESVVAQSWYRELRDATLADLSPVFTASPATIAFGGWDSSRKAGQLRLRGLFVSELFGVTADADAATPTSVSKRSGARLDPLGQQIRLSPDDYERLLEAQRDQLSEKTIKNIEGEIAKARKSKKAEMIPAASLVLGGIPPATDTPFGVSVPEVRRARTYSLAGLRRLRFGGSAEDDVAARTALLAMMLLGAAYADADPEIRAYCDVSTPSGQTFLDDEVVELDLSIESCERFLEEAIDGLPERLAWDGQVIELVGDPALDRGAVDEGADADDA